MVATSELFGFKTALETFAIQRYKKNQEMASIGLEFVLHRLYLPDLPLPPSMNPAATDQRTSSTKFTDAAKNLFKPSSTGAL